MFSRRAARLAEMQRDEQRLALERQASELKERERQEAERRENERLAVIFSLFTNPIHPNKSSRVIHC